MPKGNRRTMVAFSRCLPIEIALDLAHAPVWSENTPSSRRPPVSADAFGVPSMTYPLQTCGGSHGRG